VSRVAQEAVELRLAETGTELRAAVEAAQYARIVSQEEAGPSAETEAAASFVARFEACAEGWPETGTAGAEGTQRQMLAGLSRDLERLESLGLFVHWGIVGRALTTPERGRVTLPVAIVTISRSARPARVVLVPAELGVSDAPTEPRH
jgi:hypothetical protein